MKIGIVAFGWGLGHTGGLQVFTRDLLRAVATHDHVNEYVALLGPGDPTPAVPEGRPVRCVRLPAMPRGSPATWLSPGALATAWADTRAQEIDRLGLDVVHYPATRLRERGLRTPAVLTFFDMQEEYLPSFFPFRGRVARRLIHRCSVRRAAVVVAPSSFTAAALVERYGVAADKVVVLPAGVDPRFSPVAATEERERLRRTYGLPDDGFALYPANPWPHKNHEGLFTALQALARQGRRVPIVCTGRLAGESRSARSLALAAGLAESDVYDLGFVAEDDMPALYRSARLLVFPSLFEGFGLPILEAMASGCPVACAEAASLPELAGEAAELFAPGDAGGMAETIGALWESPGRREILAERGLARSRGFAWERLVPRLRDVYQQASMR